MSISQKELSPGDLVKLKENIASTPIWFKSGFGLSLGDTVTGTLDRTGVIISAISCGGNWDVFVASANGTIGRVNSGLLEAF